MAPFVKAAGVAALAAALAGCSEYLDRRETITLSGGNAVAANQVAHMVDPWPRESADRDLAFNGSRMASAVERYRTNRVLQPKGTGTSGSYGAPDPGAAPSNTTPLGPTVNAPPTK